MRDKRTYQNVTPTTSEDNMNVEDRRKVAAQLIDMAEKAVARNDELSYAKLYGACLLAEVLIDTVSVTPLYVALLKDATHSKRAIQELAP